MPEAGFDEISVSSNFIAALKQGQAQVVAEVTRLDGPQVVLADGSRLRPDAVICATGYRRGLETLVGHLGVLRPDGVPFAYRGAPEHPTAPQLYFAGMWGQFSGEIRWARSTPGASHEPQPAIARTPTTGRSDRKERREASVPSRGHSTGRRASQATLSRQR